MPPPDVPDWRAEYESLLSDLKIHGATADRYVEIALHLLDWGNETVELSECERFLRHALAVDPDHAEASLELAFFLDGIRDDPAQALPWFTRAVETITDPTAVWGYARCLAQIGRREDALRAIDESEHRADDTVKRVRAEIVDGQWDP